jgi:type II secretory pathway pseudopilin PulG
MKQKGFTVIELLIMVAVGGILTFGTVNAIFQVVVGTSRTNSQVVALTDVHHAALQLKKDLQMAQESIIFLNGEEFLALRLDWTDYTSFEAAENINHTSIYQLSNSELHRTYDGISSIVGRNITSVDVTSSDRLINVVLTSTKGDATPHSETLEFGVLMRGVLSE